MAMCAFIILCEIIIFWFFFGVGFQVARELLMIEASVNYAEL